MERRIYDFDRVVRILFVMSVVLAAVWLINYLSAVLLPFVVACVLAYVLNPIVCANKRLLHMRSRTLPSILTLVEVAAVLGVICMYLFPYIYEEMASMILIVEQYTAQKVDLPYVSEEVRKFIQTNVDMDYVTAVFSQAQWLHLAQQAVMRTWSFMGATAEVVFAIFSWMVVVLYLIFLLIDWDKMKVGIRSAIPNKFRGKTLRMVYDVEDCMHHYFRGQAMIAAIVGVLFAIGFSLVGLPLAIVLGLFIGVLNMVPYLQLISIPIAAVLCVLGSICEGQSLLSLSLGTAAVYLIVQAIQDLILTPKIMGKFMGLNPALILLSLSVWGALLGFVGLIIALPLTTLLISYYKQFVLKEEAPVKTAEAAADKEESQEKPKIDETDI